MALTKPEDLSLPKLASPRARGRIGLAGQQSLLACNGGLATVRITTARNYSRGGLRVSTAVLALSPAAADSAASPLTMLGLLLLAASTRDGAYEGL